MARIKIKDLPKDMKISAEEMRSIHAGASYAPGPPAGKSYKTTIRWDPKHRYFLGCDEW